MRIIITSILLGALISFPSDCGSKINDSLKTDQVKNFVETISTKKRDPQTNAKSVKQAEQVLKKVKDLKENGSTNEQVKEVLMSGANNLATTTDVPIGEIVGKAIEKVVARSSKTGETEDQSNLLIAESGNTPLKVPENTFISQNVVVSDVNLESPNNNFLVETQLDVNSHPISSTVEGSLAKQNDSSFAENTSAIEQTEKQPQVSKKEQAEKEITKTKKQEKEKLIATLQVQQEKLQEYKDEFGEEKLKKGKVQEFLTSTFPDANGNSLYYIVNAIRIGLINSNGSYYTNAENFISELNNLVNRLGKTSLLNAEIFKKVLEVKNYAKSLDMEVSLPSLEMTKQFNDIFKQILAEDKEDATKKIKAIKVSSRQEFKEKVEKINLVRLIINDLYNIIEGQNEGFTGRMVVDQVRPKISKEIPAFKKAFDDLQKQIEQRLEAAKTQQ